jgi:hypothetical protein
MNISACRGNVFGIWSLGIGISARDEKPRSIPLARGRSGGTILAPIEQGGVVEWLMAPVLKTGRAKALVGSNPTPTAINFRNIDFQSVRPADLKPAD